MRILVVSEDRRTSALLLELLRRSGHVAEATPSAESAIARLSEGALPECVLTDWLLPEADGIELCRRLRGTSSVPVIVMSELSQPEARRHATRAGARGYLTKPLEAQSVRSAVESVLKTSSERRLDTSRQVIADRVLTHTVWAQFDALTSEWLAACTGLPLVKAPASSLARSGSDLAATLGMVDTAASLEIHFGVRVSAAGATTLGAAMIGASELDAEAGADLLSELCNNLLGQAKAGLRSAGLDFTLAVPGARSATCVPADVAVTRQVVLGHGPFRVLVTMGLRAARTELVRADRLAENMVTAEDVKTVQGALLIPAGTLLSAVSADRVRRYLSDRAVRVVVMSAA